MPNLELAKTIDTPAIHFDHESGKLGIEGESYPENAMEFYRPVLESLVTFAENGEIPLQVDFKMLYFNSSSSKCLLDIFDILEEYAASDKDVTVNWYYQEDDEDIKESGEDFAEDLNLTFNLIAYS
ncbi:MAG: DUF1987 domain-containing protein [Acidobacteriota bacterium]|nr:DUF1987 domain-containing protein [Acidobacteriota bacterium]